MTKVAKWIFYDSLSKIQSNPISTEEVQMAILKMRPQDIERFFIWTMGWQEWQPLKEYIESNQTYFFYTLSRDVTELKNADTVKATIYASQEQTVKVSVDYLQPKNQAKEKKHSQNKQQEDTKTDARTNKPADSSQNRHSKVEEQTGSFSAINLNETEKEFLKAEKIYDSQNFDGDEITFSHKDAPKIDFKKLFDKKFKAKNREPRLELKIEIILISPSGKTFRSKSKNISLSGALLEDNVPFEYSGISFDIAIINKHANDKNHESILMRGKTVGEGLTQRLFFSDDNPEQKNKLQKLLQHYLDLKENFVKKKVS